MAGHVLVLVQQVVEGRDGEHPGQPIRQGRQLRTGRRRRLFLPESRSFSFSQSSLSNLPEMSCLGTRYSMSACSPSSASSPPSLAPAPAAPGRSSWLEDQHSTGINSVCLSSLPSIRPFVCFMFACFKPLPQVTRHIGERRTANSERRMEKGEGRKENSLNKPLIV